MEGYAKLKAVNIPEVLFKFEDGPGDVLLSKFQETKNNSSQAKGWVCPFCNTLWAMQLLYLLRRPDPEDLLQELLLLLQHLLF